MPAPQSVFKLARSAAEELAVAVGEPEALASVELRVELGLSAIHKVLEAAYAETPPPPAVDPPVGRHEIPRRGGHREIFETVAPRTFPVRSSKSCVTCPSHCCSNKFGYQSIRLNREEREHPLFKDHLVDGEVLRLEGRHCRFLDPAANRCTIYADRPEACRGFVCHDVENQGAGTLAMIYRHRKLRAHLEAEGQLPPLERDLYWAENSRRVPTRVETRPILPNHDHCGTLTAGTWRCFKLDAASGKITLLGRYRSTYHDSWPRGKYHRSNQPGYGLVTALDPVACDPVCEDKTVYPTTTEV